MKYYTHCYPDDNDRPVFETFSEKEILDIYWDSWYSRMCNKFGKEIVDRDYCKQDCIDDWVIVHWAWESNQEKI